MILRGQPGDLIHSAIRLSTRAVIKNEIEDSLAKTG
jgi:hypothetical protein